MAPGLGELGQRVSGGGHMFGKTTRGEVEGSRLELRGQEKAGGSSKRYLSTEAEEMGSHS